MSKYVAISTKAWAIDEWAVGSRPSETVYEADRAPVATGLCDQHGTPIYRTSDAIQLGFDLSKGRKA